MAIPVATTRLRCFIVGSGSDWFRLPLVPLTQGGFKSGGGQSQRRDGGGQSIHHRLDSMSWRSVLKQILLKVIVMMQFAIFSV